MDRKQYLLVMTPGKLFFRLVSFTLDQSSPAKIARPVDSFLNLEHLGLVLEHLIQGRSA